MMVIGHLKGKPFTEKITWHEIAAEITDLVR